MARLASAPLILLVIRMELIALNKIALIVLECPRNSEEFDNVVFKIASHSKLF